MNLYFFECKLMQAAGPGCPMMSDCEIFFMRVR
jgi:hypothetical protein